MISPGNRRVWPVLLILAGLLLVSIIFSAGIGAVHVSPGEMVRVIWGHLHGSSLASQNDAIIWDIRLPRVLLAVLVGASLAVSGMLMQSLFHNPMADPYIVGVSAGASVGTVVAVVLGIDGAFCGLSLPGLCAFAGGLTATAVVYTLSHRRGRVPIGVLLLTGIAVGGLLQAITAFLLIGWKESSLRSVMNWTMGSLAMRSDWADVRALLPYTLIGLAVAFAWRRDLNILALGDETAHHLGIHLERTRFLLLFTAALLAAGPVAVSGIIAFVGLIVPHSMRLLIGPNHRSLFLACLLGGGVLLVWADVLARTLLHDQEVPIGVVTSVLGCVFFLYLLNRRENRV